MRVLIVTHAERSHFLGMVPLAWALVTAGHDVRVASQPELAPVIAAAGLPAVPVGREHSFWRVLNTFSAFDPLADRLPLFGRADRPDEEFGWEELKDGYRRVVPWWWRVLNDPMVADLTAFCLHWRPDLVIWDPTTYAAPIAARAAGAAHARHMWGVDVLARVRAVFLRRRDEAGGGPADDALAGWLSRRAAAHGVEFTEELVTGQFTVDYVPPSLRLPGGPPLTRVPMRYVPHNGRSVLPAWLREPPRRPRVCLCLGLSAAERSGGYAVSMGEVVEAVSELDVEVVALVSPAAGERLDTVPGNVRVVPFAPLHQLLPTCAAVVDHGGSATVLNTLAHAVPQLVVARPTFCEPVIGRRVTAAGAGLDLPSEEATGELVRDAVRRLLAEPGFAGASARVRAEMVAMPSPNAVVAELEEQVERHRAVSA
ncbi:activator-dependent family glycosyltransferase [Nonomuraea sp. MCN248]|uniref:Activator-dependent family glycosyltransferase n=1 Tax=Nonomuraea corallina TaxID=2989783 RepID=A0ABT4SF01_9ACTN|nr:activator-dependent family glycosyltransferase [Nonomuraea corallina]MDA0635762.1 activator-dependent family glycosyltransferase [Nonomuraea corallina]